MKTFSLCMCGRPQSSSVAIITAGTPCSSAGYVNAADTGMPGMFNPPRSIEPKWLPPN
ncbi:MAG: hypothetical protein JNJ67_05240 [Chromatiales bacterium]|nr:hypothetical protein [Chromatiales bacterium]